MHKTITPIVLIILLSGFDTGCIEPSNNYKYEKFERCIEQTTKYKPKHTYDEEKEQISIIRKCAKNYNNFEKRKCKRFK